MDKISRILNHPVFKECIRLNEETEADRIFCHHDAEHAFAVARIAMLLNQEEKLGLSKDLIYGAALLHDCGRYKQYTQQIPHEKASANIAEQILSECGYGKEEILCIREAVLSHRGFVAETKESILAELLYRADKMSRNCFLCKAYKECNWSKEAKEQLPKW